MGTGFLLLVLWVSRVGVFGMLGPLVLSLGVMTSGIRSRARV